MGMKYKRLATLGMVFVFFLLMANANSEKLVLQNGVDGYTGCADGSYYTHDPEKKYNNSGGILYFYSNCWIENTHVTARSVIKFDLSLLPENAVIDSAFLKVVQFWGTKTDSADIIDLYLTTSDWTEKSLVWGNHPDTTGESFGGIPYATSLETNIRWDVTEGIRMQFKGDNFGFTTIPRYRNSVYSMNAYSSESSKINKRPSLTLYYHTGPTNIVNNTSSVPNTQELRSISIHDDKLLLVAENPGLYNLELYTVRGQLVSKFEELTLHEGANSVSLNGSSDLSKGMYLIKIKGDNYSQYKKVWYE